MKQASVLALSAMAVASAYVPAAAPGSMLPKHAISAARASSGGALPPCLTPPVQLAEDFGTR